MSSRVITTQYVVQLVPYVKGQVVKIHAQPNQPLKKGDLLLEINPEPYQFTVNQVQAQIASGKFNVQQAGGGLSAAKANVLKAKADVLQAAAMMEQAKAGVATALATIAKVKALDVLAITNEQIAQNVRKQDAGAISDIDLARAVQNRQAADAAVKEAEAAADQARAVQAQAQAGLAVAHAGEQQAEAGVQQAGFAVDAAQSNVNATYAQLSNANFNLAQCKMVAPADGYVVNWQVQEGTMLVPAPIAAAGVFISTAETWVVASFPQNDLMNVQPGDEVEVVLDPCMFFYGVCGILPVL